MGSFHRRTRLSGESLECRALLTAFGFVERPMEGRQITYDAVSTMADLDGDGDLDLIGGNISWRANDGTGSFGDDQIVSTQADYVDQIIAADVDGDGDNDVVTTSEREIAWYENRNGKGRFGPKRVIGLNDGMVYSLSATDLDGDDDVDLFQISKRSLEWYENTDGVGHFQRVALQISDVPSFPPKAIALDLDADGDQDFVMAGYWLENDGSGAFAPLERLIAGDFDGAAFTVDDFDNNGEFDFMLSNEYRVDWYEMVPGTLDFQFRRSYFSVDDNPGYMHDFISADLDGDQHVELVIDSYKGADAVGHTTVLDLESGENHARDNTIAAIHDVDGGGIEDLIFLGYWESSESSQQYDFRDTLEVSYVAKQVELADLDGDSDLDIVAWGRNFSDSCPFRNWPCDNLTWSENLDGRGTFGTRQLISQVGGPFDIADFDSDGTDEIFNGRIWSLTEDGTFVADDEIAGHPFLVVDWDGDGDPDVISVDDGDPNVITVFDGSIYLHENQRETSSFLAATKLVDHGFKGLVKIYASDVDLDGDLDILAAPGNKVVWYQNLGNDQNLAPPEVLFETTRQNDQLNLLPGDYDLDGDVDLVVMYDRVLLVENVDGVFSQVESIKVDSMEDSIVFDVDVDGDLDLIPVSHSQLTNEWFENINGTFGSKHRIFIDSVAAFGDIDGDGDVDYVTGEREFDWYENRPLGDSNGDGKFNSADFVVVMQAAKYEDDVPNNATFEEGDWNGDGDFDSADLVVAMQAGNYTLDVRASPDPIVAAFADLDALRNGLGQRTAFVS